MPFVKRDTHPCHSHMILTFFTQRGALAAIITSYNDEQRVEAADVSKWIGKVIWPATTSFSIAAAGATLIYTALVRNGYTAIISYKSTTAGTEVTYAITPPAASGPGAARGLAVSPDDIRAHWKTAIAADTQDDQHQDEGVKPASSFAANGHASGAQNDGHETNGSGQQLDNDVDSLDKHFSKIQLKTITA